MAVMNISLRGAHDGEILHLSGAEAANEGIELAKGGVDGFYEAPVETIWERARRQRGGTFRGIEHPERDMTLAFHVMNMPGVAWQESAALLRNSLSYHLDPWWADDNLATLQVETDDDYRELAVQMSEEPELDPDHDPDVNGYAKMIVSLKAAQPFWQGKTAVSTWEASGSSGSGTVTVSNPTDVPMYLLWVLDPGTWTIPDVSWTGRPGKRTPGGEYANRSITLNPVTTTMGGLVIDTDPMERTFSDAAGTNVVGAVGGGYYIINREVPPRTPKTQLPVSVTGAAAGAGVELHQVRLWGGVWS